MTTSPPATPSSEPAKELDPNEPETEQEAAMRRAMEEAVALLDRGEVQAARTLLTQARHARE